MDEMGKACVCDKCIQNFDVEFLASMSISLQLPAYKMKKKLVVLVITYITLYYIHYIIFILYYIYLARKAVWEHRHGGGDGCFCASPYLSFCKEVICHL
jgi:hypothetical protein